jgi:predicted AlkP superfamily phosphohydrolase/phosphomutase
MENLNNTDKTSDNAEKELRISDVIDSSNFTKEEASIYLQKKLFPFWLITGKAIYGTKMVQGFNAWHHSLY